MKVLKRCAHAVEAEMLVSFLKASGIDAVALDVHTSAIASFYLGPNNVRVAVPELQWHRARELLREVEETGVHLEDDDDE